ncbi:acyltransferase [Candidatus Weimeria sp. HCP3S3_B5]|uniref:acyltransferase n=1 Tax=Candidatus Weimeria sp. HCP3S3_B5 TaxID=3438871 RepID=UPI003F8B75F1
MGKVELIRKLDIFMFIKYNFMLKNVIRDPGCYLITYRGAKIDLSDKAKIILHANYHCCSSKFLHSKAEAYLQLLDGGILEVNGPVAQNYGSHVEVNYNAKISIGKAVIKPNAVIVSNQEIEIGNDVLISRYVIIYDSDFHKIKGPNGELKVHSKKTIIGNHVWIGIKSSVLKGAIVGDGAVVAVGSTVTGKVKAGMTAMGYPARSFSTVEWED